MKSIHAERNMSMKHIASAARRREGMNATRKAALAAWAGPGILIVLLVAALVYVALGGTLALEASPASEPDTSKVEAAVIAARAAGAPRREFLSNNSADPTDYFPSGYVNRGRDGDGNVMTYEHD